MKKFNFFVLFITLAVFTMPILPLSAQDNPMTMKDAILKALDHPAVKAEKMVYKAEKEAVKSSRSPLFPTLDLSVNGGYERVHNTLTRSRQTTGADDDNYRDLWTDTQTLSLTQLLYDGSSTLSRYAAQRHRTDSSRILASNSADEIALRTIESYMDVLRARKTVRLAKDNITALKALRGKTRDRLDSGKGTITDVNRVQLTLSDANAVLVNYQGALQYAMDRFRTLTGAGADMITRQQTIDPDKVITTVDEAVKTALENNKSIQVAKSNIQQKEADLKTSKALYHPKVNLVLQAAREENADGLKDTDYTLSGLVKTNFNLYRGGGDRAKIYQDARLLSEARLRLQEVKLEIETRVRLEYTNMETSEKKIPLINQKVEQDLKVLRNYEEQFLVGKRDILDVIEAQKMLFTFQAALENVETEKTLSQFRLLTITGQLLDTLGIDFNPES